MTKRKSHVIFGNVTIGRVIKRIPGVTLTHVVYVEGQYAQRLPQTAPYNFTVAESDTELETCPCDCESLSCSCWYHAQTLPDDEADPTAARGTSTLQLVTMVEAHSDGKGRLLMQSRLRDPALVLSQPHRKAF